MPPRRTATPAPAIAPSIPTPADDGGSFNLGGVPLFELLIEASTGVSPSAIVSRQEANKAAKINREGLKLQNAKTTLENKAEKTRQDKAAGDANRDNMLRVARVQSSQRERAAAGARFIEAMEARPQDFEPGSIANERLRMQTDMESLRHSGGDISLLPADVVGEIERHQVSRIPSAANAPDLVEIEKKLAILQERESADRLRGSIHTLTVVNSDLRRDLGIAEESFRLSGNINDSVNAIRRMSTNLVKGLTKLGEVESALDQLRTRSAAGADIGISLEEEALKIAALEQELEGHQNAARWMSSAINGQNSALSRQPPVGTSALPGEDNTEGAAPLPPGEGGNIPTPADAASAAARSAAAPSPTPSNPFYQIVPGVTFRGGDGSPVLDNIPMASTVVLDLSEQIFQMTGEYPPQDRAGFSASIDSLLEQLVQNETMSAEDSQAARALFLGNLDEVLPR